LGADATSAQELAAALIDWRDADSTTAIPLGSAEDSYYRNEKSPYEAKDAPFEALDEVRLVKGFNANVFEKLKNYITIYGSGKVNINTAGRELLYIVGFSQVTADKILDLRAGKDGFAGTADDIVFTSISDIGPKLSQASGFSVSDITALNAVVEAYMSVTSTAFTINSVGISPGEKDSGLVSCVIDIKGRILAYRRQ